jgi:uncharacterized protein (DUF952 family)
MSKVFKICEKKEWDDVKNKDVFKGSKSDQIDGFIHLSTAKQLKGTLEKYFKTKSPLYLLEVYTDDLELVWEVSRNKQLFPHLYQPLPLNSVARVHTISMDTEGNHIIPEQVFNDQKL